MNSLATAPIGHQPLIALLEDDPGVRRSMLMLLRGRGFDVKAHASAQSLLADPDTDRASCLLFDYRLGDSDGIAVLETLRRRGWTGPAMLMTGHGSAELAARAQAAGFSEIFEKPLRDIVLLAALERATAH